MRTEGEGSNETNNSHIYSGIEFTRSRQTVGNGPSSPSFVDVQHGNREVKGENFSLKGDLDASIHQAARETKVKKDLNFRFGKIFFHQI